VSSTNQESESGIATRRRPCTAGVSEDHAAGLDFCRRFPKVRRWFFRPGQRALVPTGLTIALPSGYEGQGPPAPGLASARHHRVNAPGHG